MKSITQKSVAFFLVFVILASVSIGGVAYALSSSQGDGFCDDVVSVIVCCSVDDDNNIGSCEIVGPIAEGDE